MKNILYITTSSLGTNPRLIKSVIAHKKGGYNCTIMCFKLGNWSDALDEQLIEKHKLDCYTIDASRRNFVYWLLIAGLHRIISSVNAANKLNLLAYQLNKRSLQLRFLLINKRPKPDLIIAHNLGALYPAYYYSVKNNIKFAFDIEDYHPGELIPVNSKIVRENREKLMREILPHTTFLTAASYHIAKKTSQLLASKRPIIVINNSFFASEFTLPIEENTLTEKLEIVWFSQNISFGRGLEVFFESAKRLNKHINITLIGELDEVFYSKYIQQSVLDIRIIPPLSQPELHKKLSEFDIGLALELINQDENRNLCLTNKIFAYAQAGLFILATDTKGQQMFLEQHPNLGLLTGQNSDIMTLKLEELIAMGTKIKSEKKERFLYSQDLAYESEASKLLNLTAKAI